MTRMLVLGGLSALMLGGSVVGCTAGTGGRIASASDRAIGDAAGNAGKADKALARHDAAAAVGFAEAAVATAPHNAGYRLLLGQSYLQAGRFGSARSAFADAIQLQPGNGKAALNLALAQIATGDWGVARQTLTANAQAIPATDRGLALALAGDPTGGVGLLTQVVRSPETSAKARQNLALALALAGQWNAARIVAAADVAPADLDARMAQWAAFAQPHGASDQVASLLGVRPIEDAGQPVALALNAPVGPVQVAEAEAMPVVAPLAVPAPAETVATSAPVKPLPAVASAAPVAVRFAAPRAVVQPLPAVLLRPEAGPVKVSVTRTASTTTVPATATAPVPGTWFVQIGAFDSAGVARDAWSRATRRMPALAQHGPSGTNFHARNGQFYRLSVGGFTRADADALCRRYRAIGGSCFVRAVAGDRVAKWVPRDGVQLASR